MKFILLSGHRLNLDRVNVIYPNENNDKDLKYEIVIEYAKDYRFIMKYDTEHERDQNMKSFDLVAGVNE